jgi:KRAB domain-containing zinc finger protein
MRRHSDIRPFQCKECYKTFVTKSELNSHSKVHIELRLITCLQCSKKFKSKSEFKMHIMNMHNVELNYKCE